MSTEYLFARKFNDGSFGLIIRGTKRVVTGVSTYTEKCIGKVEPRHYNTFHSMIVSSDQRCLMAELLWTHGEEESAKTFAAAMGTCPTATVEALPEGMPTLEVPVQPCCDPDDPEWLAAEGRPTRR